MKFRVIKKEYLPYGTAYFRTKKEAIAHIEKFGGTLQKKLAGYENWVDWE
jgi:hypothetical protein